MVEKNKPILVSEEVHKKIMRGVLDDPNCKNADDFLRKRFRIIRFKKQVRKKNNVD